MPVPALRKRATLLAHAAAHPAAHPAAHAAAPSAARLSDRSSVGTLRGVVATGLVLASAAAAATGLAAPAQAKRLPTADATTVAGTTTGVAASGGYTVTVNGRSYRAAAGKDVVLKDVTPTGPITVAGVHTGFTLDPATLGVRDYALTGAPSPERMVTTRTVVFAGKVPQLSPAQIGRPVIKQLQVRDAGLVVILGAAGGKLKVQAKDAPQGGIFQMEPEFAGPVEIVHTLGPGLFYFANPFTGKVNFGDGADPVTGGGADAHEMLLGKDSPQVATKLFQGATSTRWSVAPGGRMGGVLGEDAIELSAGATSCTSGCQAQNQVNGSLPVPPLPLGPVPLG